MRTAKALLPLCLLLLAGVVHAGEKRDAAGLAKVIAPFIDEQTVAIIHVDPTRVDASALVETMARFIPDLEGEMAPAKAAATKFVETWRKANARDAYLVVTMQGAPRNPVFAVIPLTSNSDEKTIAGLLPRTQTQRLGDALVVSETREMLERVKQLKAVSRPELVPAFEAAGDAAVQALLLPPQYVRRVIEEMMPEIPPQAGGGSSKVITEGIQWAAAGIDAPPKLAVNVVVKSKDAQAAEALRAKLVQVFGIVSSLPETRKIVPKFDEFAKLVTPKVDGDRLVLVLNEENKGIESLMALVTPPVEAARTAARRSQSANNLKHIGLAMHNYYDANKSFPPAASRSNDGKPLLSWRVHLLPYLDQADLYKQFHLDEPWDSEHNKALIGKMPAVFRSPSSKLPPSVGKTNYVVPVGPNTGFGGNEPLQFKDIIDGTSNTIMTLEVNDDHAVIWTKPDDLPFDPKNPFKGLHGLYPDGFNAGIFDGSVRLISKTVSPDTLRALLTPAGGEVVGDQ